MIGWVALVLLSIGWILTSHISDFVHVRMYWEGVFVDMLCVRWTCGGGVGIKIYWLMGWVWDGAVVLCIERKNEGKRERLTRKAYLTTNDE